ncbi:flavodoxin family protein [bacterium]|nr:flavodoxin family protein [bacterium]
MKKIVVLSASPRKNGNCDSIVEFAKKQYEGIDSLDVDYVNIRDLKNVKNCISCDSCKKTKKCIHKDDIAEVLNKIHESDSIAFISPIYFGYPPATIKMLVDRLYAYFDPSKGFEVPKDKIKKMLVAFSFGTGPAEQYDKVAHETAFNFMVIGVNEHKTIMLGNQNDKKTFSEKVANDSEFADKIKSLFDWLAE